MNIKITENCRRAILLEDISQHHPGNDPYIILGCTFSKHFSTMCGITGMINTFCHVSSYLVPIEQKERALDSIDWDDIGTLTPRDFFEDDGSYNPGEIFEEKGVQFEIIVNDRWLPSLELNYYEPTDRLIRYHNLHRQEEVWIDPENRHEVIRSQRQRSGEDKSLFIKMRKSELIDYLAARKSGLLITRYSECLMYTNDMITNVPQPFNDQQTKHGRLSWSIDENSSSHDYQRIYFSRLREIFWIDPASKPRRWDYPENDRTRHDVIFTLADGEEGTFSRPDGTTREWEIVSFRPNLLSLHLQQPGSTINFYTLTVLGLNFPDGSLLRGCINREGQFQAFHGDLVLLPERVQRSIAGYSMPKMAGPSEDFIKMLIEGQWPSTAPLNETLARCLRDLNEPWRDDCGETLLLSPSAVEITPSILIGPVTQDFEELADLMLELNKAIIPEGSIRVIKERHNLSGLVDTPQNYQNMRSIAYVRALFQSQGISREEDKSGILGVINRLRQVKGHPANVKDTVKMLGLDGMTPRRAYIQILIDLCLFLEQFKDVTLRLYPPTVDTWNLTSDSHWEHLQRTRIFFQSLIS